MNQARADIDNVAVSPSPRTTLFSNDFAAASGEWTFEASGQWNLTSIGTFAQNSIGSDARAAIGTQTDDQSLSVRLRLAAFALPTGAQERWLGVMARYRDPTNY